MIHQKIEKLIPYLSENFVTYPLWEEGKYIPFVNFWQKSDTDMDFLEMEGRIKEIFNNTGYSVDYSDNNFSDTIHEYYVYPEFTDLENGGYDFVKKDWSIEEMLDLLGSVLK